eukprot:s1473_g6.t1
MDQVLIQLLLCLTVRIASCPAEMIMKSSTGVFREERCATQIPSLHSLAMKNMKEVKASNVALHACVRQRGMLSALFAALRLERIRV